MLGEFIAKGSHRRVYLFKDNPDYIVKVALKTKHKNINRLNKEINRLEYEVWTNAAEEIKKHLVPVIWISESNEIIICKRGKKLRRNKLNILDKKKIPKIFYGYKKYRYERKGSIKCEGWGWKKDLLKRDNWVVIDGKILLADYPELHENFATTVIKYKTP